MFTFFFKFTTHAYVILVFLPCSISYVPRSFFLFLVCPPIHFSISIYLVWIIHLPNFTNKICKVIMSIQLQMVNLGSWLNIRRIIPKLITCYMCITSMHVTVMMWYLKLIWRVNGRGDDHPLVIRLPLLDFSLIVFVKLHKCSNTLVNEL
jgi:hypothetical protein